jgi:hypothetical protein
MPFIKGYKLTDKQKENVRTINLGRKQSPETIEKRRQKLLGGKRTLAVRKILSEGKLGKLNPCFGKIPWNKGTIGVMKSWNKGQKGLQVAWNKKFYNDDERKSARVFNQQNREARKKGNGGSYTLEQWNELIKKFDYMCLCCKRKQPEIKLTVDHILPISMGGRNSIENLQPLCFSCNARKNAKHIDYISSFYEVKQTNICQPQ